MNLVAIVVVMTAAIRLTGVHTAVLVTKKFLPTQRNRFTRNLQTVARTTSLPTGARCGSYFFADSKSRLQRISLLKVFRSSKATKTPSTARHLVLYVASCSLEIVSLAKASGLALQSTTPF